LKKAGLLVLFATVVLFIFQVGPVHLNAQTQRSVTQLSIGPHLIQAELAVTGPELRRGLMFRERLGADEGMLFDYGKPADICMWMKDTLIPLSVAFIDDKGIIVNIEDMTPRSLVGHCSERPVRFALEMNLGWFAKRGIAPGAVVKGLPGDPSGGLEKGRR
jgi:uncharacterized membrane protein (UPF0127 family)